MAVFSGIDSTDIGIPADTSKIPISPDIIGTGLSYNSSQDTALYKRICLQGQMKQVSPLSPQTRDPLQPYYCGASSGFGKWHAARLWSLASKH
uniref:Uncharacterized protein n=1 Tax=Coccidioides posadasii RMSCC 3488 TaxID=454284 RepID=A0A0J6FM10_COCPO|nr:hypothetical protein CPAG_07720 [Coccidioides posadasii RMSCC 3488]